MENIWPVIIVGAIAAVAGYLFGMLDSRVTAALKEGRDKIVAAEEEKKVALKVDEHDVLRVTIDPALKWHLELDSARIEPDGLTPEQRARLVNVIVQIRPWIDGKTAPVPVPAPLAPPPAALAPVAAAPIPVPVSIGIRPAETPAPRVDIGRGLRTMIDNEFTKKSEPLKGPSIVGMIDEVLQKKLANSPLAGKRIRLEEGAVGEVIVYVGMTRYSGIDAVPDEDIKAIIHEAITEWDKK